jgi:serine/threonine-protein kinase
VKVCAQCRIQYPDALEYCPQDGTLLPETTAQTQAMYDPLIGETVDGRYKIEAQLGEGGMGVVYAARHVIIDKRVAIKVLKREAQQEETASQRFIQEARSASKIGHANIVDINDFGVLPDGSAYFVMEFLEGQTLGQAIREGPLAASRVVAIAAQMARGLNAAHAKGIIHRDLKPENVFLLERDGHGDVVKIVDFGIAKVQSGLGQPNSRLTQVGMVLGTPEYMSPEQATGKESDHRVDEYALGCMIYEMLTGDVPFKGESAAGTLTKHVFEAVVPPRERRPDLTIPPGIEAVCLRAMAKQADQRYPSISRMLG